MKTLIFILATFLLLIGCINNDVDKDVMPETIVEIVELSQNSPEHLNLYLDVENIETDSLLVQIYLDNSSPTNADTLYHSSSFTLNVAYINKNELTHPFVDLVFFDDLNSTVVKANSKKLISSYKIKSLSSTPYKIISLFRYTQGHPDNDSSKLLWLASDTVKVK